jgi:23S rRNA (cytosine1962-C5)-methyltransferase
MLVRIHAKDARAVAQGHPWVYRQAIVERPKGLRVGEVVDVATAETDFVARGLYDPTASVAVRVWTRERGERFDAALVARRTRDAVAARERLGIPARADAWRAVHGEADRLPGVIVDRWGPYATITLQGDAVRRHERTIVDGVVAALEVEGVYLHDDERARPVTGNAFPEELLVREPTGRFLVHLTTPGKPGLFTDMREVRVALAQHLRGRSFLNLFAHTGAFSAAAAGAGASEVVSVDLSRPYLEIARRNVETNAPGARHELVGSDVFEALRRFASEGRRFDVVLADPPTFSSSKASGAFSVRDDYRSLARASLRVLAPGGLLVAATNSRTMEDDAFLRLLHDAAEMERAHLRVVELMGQPADHPSLAMVPETRHLLVAFLHVTHDARSD